MDVLYPCCAGLDVHARQVTACVRQVADGVVTRQHQVFAATTDGLTRLATWLRDQGCTHVAMEATGVYWKPVWQQLDGTFALILANALHIKAVPGRKSDLNDAAWIADLLAHGLIRGSFVPPAAVQEWRDLTRTRKPLIREIRRHTLRIQKTLEAAQVKLTHVLTDILGTSGRAILHALVAGETDPARLAALPRGRVKASPAEFVDALHGHVTAHHRFVLQTHLVQIESLERAVVAIDARLAEQPAPFQAAVALLTTMPGLGDTAARAVVAEIGTDMTRFPTAGHLVSWAGLCPRLHESAGKRRSTRLRHGAPWLKTTLIQAAWAASRTKNTYLRSQFQRLKARRGPKKAMVAVAASMLTAVFYMLRNGVVYPDLGPRYLDEHDKTRLTTRLVRRLEALGNIVEIKAA